VHARANLQLPRHKALGKTKASYITEHDPHVDAKRAVHAAAVTAGAPGPGGVHNVLHESVVHITFAFHYFAESGLYLVGWNLLGILVVNEIIGAGVGTQAAVSADLQPGA
jgi:hypothetical protein